MKTADLVIGNDYAHAPSGYGSPDRVRITEKLGGGLVQATVIEAGSGWSHLTVGTSVEIRVQKVTSTWAQWLTVTPQWEQQEQERQAAARAEKDAQDRAHEDAGKIRPDRQLPDRYEDFITHYFDKPVPMADLIERVHRHARMGPVTVGDTTTLPALLADLPNAVSRDLVAAVRDDAHRRGHLQRPETVGAVFARAASVLRAAFEAAKGGGASPSSASYWPTAFSFTDVDVAFVDALTVDPNPVRGVPSVPSMPHFPAAVAGDVLARFGWVHLAHAYTSGELLHATGCRHLGRGAEPLADCDTVPVWYSALHGGRRLCSTCGGPTLRHLREVAHFMAAVDVWNARGRGPVEDWQRAAFGRLVGASVAADVATAPDRAGRIAAAERLIGAVAGTDHGERGWQLYAVANGARPGGRGGQDLTGLDETALEALRRDAAALLDAAEAAVGPQPLAGPAWVAVADPQALWVRMSRLEVAVPHAGVLMFTLPDAVL